MIDKKSTRAKELITYALITYALILSGCGKELQYKTNEEKPQVIYLENIDKSTATHIAEDVLAKMHFIIEKADPNVGLIKTKPLPAAQFFEFWRTDNVGRLNSAEANLHSLQRIVQLNITQENNNIRIVCNAQVYKLSMPESQFTSSGRAYEMFTASLPEMQRIKLQEEQKESMAWINLGQDEKLATEILKRIEKQSSRCTGK